MPGGILLAGVALLAHSGWLILSPPAFSFLCYGAFLGGMLLAWRFHSTRIFFALLLLFLAREASPILLAGSYAKHGWSALEVLWILVPLNFVFIALMQDYGFSLGTSTPIGLLWGAEAIVVTVLAQSEKGLRHLPSHPHRAIASFSLSNPILFAFAVAGIFLVARSILTRKLTDGALLWSLLAIFLSLRFIASDRIATAYAATAGCILAIAIIENSYLLAYHDELTALPSRRAFTDALRRLQEPYSIAVVDIDHFKRFNDNHGHDVGDQVLRLVAAKLAHVGGAGQAYRCGGEEFAILYPRKTTAEVVPHLEQLRAAIEASEFCVRSNDRRLTPRGPERRNQPTRTRARKGDAIRQLTQHSSRLAAITVSIGVATSAKERLLPDLVMQAADKALYRAKANGRNRMEVAPSAVRRSKAKAAGIA